MTVRLNGKELADNYNVRVALAVEASITATTSGTANTCISSGAFSITNEGTYLVEVYTPYLTIGTTNLDVELRDGTTLLQSLSGHMAASVALPGCTLTTFVYLAAGAHSLVVKAFVDAGTGKFGAGAGTTGVAPNAYLTVSPA